MQQFFRSLLLESIENNILHFGILINKTEPKQAKEKERELNASYTFCKRKKKSFFFFFFVVLYLLKNCIRYHVWNMVRFVLCTFCHCHCSLTILFFGLENHMSEVLNMDFFQSLGLLLFLLLTSDVL